MAAGIGRGRLFMRSCRSVFSCDGRLVTAVSAALQNTHFALTRGAARRYGSGSARQPGPQILARHHSPPCQWCKGVCGVMGMSENHASRFYPVFQTTNWLAVIDHRGLPRGVKCWTPANNLEVAAWTRGEIIRRVNGPDPENEGPRLSLSDAAVKASGSEKPPKPLTAMPTVLRISVIASRLVFVASGGF